MIGRTAREQPRSFSREPRTCSPCRNYLKGRCHNRASCKYRHDHDGKQRHGLGPASRNCGSLEEKVDSISMTSHGHEENLRITSFSREPMSRSPCRYFRRGTCRYGASCRNRHDQSAQQQPAISSRPGSLNESLDTSSPENDEVNQHNNTRTESFLRDPGRRSPCRFFLKGTCHRGASCGHPHPVTVYAKTKYDEGTQKYQGVPPRSQNRHFDEAYVSREVKNNKMHSVNEVAAIKHSREWPMEEQLGRNRVDMDWKSSGGSLNRQKNSSSGDFCGDKGRLEVCLKFTEGRCNRGKSCKFLHSYHEYASSISPRSKRSFSAGATDVMNVGGTSQTARTVAAQEHDDTENVKMQSSERKHTDSSLDSTDDVVLEFTPPERENPDTTKEKPCEICGDIGYVDVLFFCCICNITCEHIYCMTISYEGDPEEWVCEDCGTADQISSSKLDTENPASLQMIPNSNAEKDGVNSGHVSVQVVHPSPAEGLGNDVHANAQTKDCDPEDSCCISRARSPKGETCGSTEVSLPSKPACPPDALEFERQLQSSVDRFFEVMQSGASYFKTRLN